MSPADELRAAATRLEELAGKATSAPWRTADVKGIFYVVSARSGPVTMDNHDPVCRHDCVQEMDAVECGVAVERDEGEGGRADADWMVALGPQVAAPLVALLNAAADAADNYPALEDPDSHVSRMVADPDQAGSYRYTAHLIRNGLDLARVINGTTS